MFLFSGGQRQYGMRSLPNTYTHEQQWESNNSPSHLESNALSTWPYALSVWVVRKFALHSNSLPCNIHRTTFKMLWQYSQSELKKVGQSTTHLIIITCSLWLRLAHVQSPLYLYPLTARQILVCCALWVHVHTGLFMWVLLVACMVTIH